MAYRYHIGGWIGTLGNHLLQMSHAVFLAERYNGVCTFQEDSLLENKTFDFSNGEPIQETFYENFFEPMVKFTPDGRDYADDLHRERPRILKTYILPIFKPYKKIELEYDIVINIRGGEVFDDKTDPQYVQSPFNYFVAIIEKEQPSNILVVAHDERNPTVQMLRDSKFNIKVLTDGTPGEDANYVLNAKTLIIGGMSTFHNTLAQISPNLKKVYYPEFGDGWDVGPDELWRKDHWYREGNILGDIDAEIIKVYFKDYVRMGQWDKYTTDEKFKWVTSYPIEKVFFDIHTI